MGNKPFVTALLVIGFFGLCRPGYSWEKTYTHPALSQEAANISQVGAYLQNQLGYDSGLNAQLQITNTTTPFIQDLIDRGMNPSMDTRSIADWVKTGSLLEDAHFWQARSQHHFHDPLRNTGLDNRTDYPDWEGAPTWFSPFDLRGESALFWVTTGTSSTGYPKNNLETWTAARNKFYSALTPNIASAREQCMAETFIALGHILHMVEDMGVPAHTRNDFLFGHYRAVYDWGNPLEDWVEEQIEDNNGQSPWSGTGPVVFDKLAEYFDANAYTGGYLGDGQWPPQGLWGLSECTNYQFLSFSTVFGCSGVKYQFPHPDRDKVEPDLLEPAPAGEKVYFNGLNYGVTHLARDSYTRYVAAGFGYTSIPVIDSTITTDDVNVFEDYADITVPRTIDYATGLLNYFFRGKLEIEPNCLDCNTVTFVIRNISDNSGVAQALKGGTFELYWDDRDGNRSEVNDFAVAGWTAGSELGYDQQVTGTFSRPDSNELEMYTVVYKGAISENPAQPDYSDANAIAVGTLLAGYPIIVWGRDNEGQVSNVPEGNDFVDVAAGKYHALAIRSSGSLVAWGWNDDGQCDVPEGNDFIAIAGGVRHSIALKSDGSIVGWGGNGSGQIDVPGSNNFVAIASGDYHNLAITTDGLIVGWGQNYYGECDAPEPNVGTVYVEVSAGRYHSLALQSDGTVRAWGSNSMGQTRIYQGAGNDHEAVAAGGDYNFLLLTDDMLVTWGGGDFIEPGIPDYHYRQPDEHDFVAIAAGAYHILALTRDSQILSWGYDDYDPPPYPVPEAIVFTRDIAAGWKFSVSLQER